MKLKTVAVTSLPCRCHGAGALLRATVPEVCYSLTQRNLVVSGVAVTEVWDETELQQVPVLESLTTLKERLTHHGWEAEIPPK
jgi:hypothetical protein